MVSSAVALATRLPVLQYAFTVAPRPRSLPTQIKRQLPSCASARPVALPPAMNRFRSSHGHGEPVNVDYGSVENARGSAFLRFQHGRTMAAQPLPASVFQRGFKCGIDEPFMHCSSWKAGCHTIPHADCLAAFNWQAADDCGAVIAELCYV